MKTNRIIFVLALALWTTFELGCGSTVTCGGEEFQLGPSGTYARVFSSEENFPNKPELFEQFQHANLDGAELEFDAEARIVTFTYTRDGSTVVETWTAEPRGL